MEGKFKNFMTNVSDKRNINIRDIKVQDINRNMIQQCKEIGPLFNRNRSIKSWETD